MMLMKTMMMILCHNEHHNFPLHTDNAIIVIDVIISLVLVMVIIMDMMVTS